MAFARLKIGHQIMGDLPGIAGTRTPVAMLVRMVAAGTPTDTIPEQHPQLHEQDVRRHRAPPPPTSTSAWWRSITA